MLLVGCQRTRLREVATALLVLYVGLLGRDLAHTLLVRHQLCEHGAEYEPPDDPAHAAPGAPVAPVPTVGAQPPCAEDPHHDHADRHCLLTRPGRLSLALVAPGGPAACAMRADRVGVLQRRAPDRGRRAPLSMAPKTSPPA